MDKLKDNLPLFSVILVLLGLTRLIAYYGFFHIDIVSFIDLTEIIQLQFTFFTIGFIFLILFSVHALDWLGRLTSDKERVKALLSTPRQDLEAQYPKANWISKNIISILFGILTISTFAIDYFSNKSKGFASPLYADLLAIFFIITFISAYSGRTLAGIKGLGLLNGKYATLLSGIGGLVILMLAAAIYSRNSAFKVMVEKPEYEVTLVLNDTVKTTKNLIYVGKSKAYIFLYDKDLDQAKVIPTTDIKSMDFKPGLINHKVPKPWRTETYKGPK
jgi:hypothetical protein